MRSFSGIWYWVLLAVSWSWMTHAPMGIPYDLLLRAAKDPVAMTDLQDMTRIAIGRRIQTLAHGGEWMLGAACFLFVGLGLLGFVYDLELAQAFFLLLFPMALVSALGIKTAHKIKKDNLQGADLQRALIGHRRRIQALGVGALFVTALWGMYQNIVQGALGG